jgi:DNA processing protein
LKYQIPPEELWIEGNLPQNENVLLTVVGSRKYTSYGRDACRKIIEGLKGYPITIVSGLAIGMDTIAHESALKNGIQTIAFPGSGLSNESLYPRSNWQLANEIVKSGGALVSELSPDTKSAIWTFPKRNRLMAAISDAVLIIEAEEKSGTLITARLALDYNKDVFVVPGSIFSPNSIGTNKLIRDGAYPILSSEDLLYALGFDPSLDKKQDTKVLGNMTPDELKVFEIIKGGPTLKEELVKNSNFSIQKINILISEMELKDILKEESGIVYLI